MNEDAKKRLREELLEELKRGERAWFYISIANDKFWGGYYLQAFGPNDAWTTMHRLGWFPLESGCDTRTCGPIPEEAMAKIPENHRWRRLSAEEVKS